MKRSSGPRKTANLSESVQQQLTMYALAAGAAGVGALELAQPAEAKIIYTPAHRVIRIHEKYELDLNHDGKIDFTISNSVSCATDMCFYALAQTPAAGNGMMGYLVNNYWLASAVKHGAGIGPHKTFIARSADLAGINYAAGPFSYVFGKWVNVRGRYLGLRFKIKGRTHYGWARLNVQVVGAPHPGITAVLTGYAYETIPGKAIIAGETKGPHDGEPTASLNTPTPEAATLGALAIGAPGLSIWRRKDSVGAIASSS
jgi:hypothetical protein